MKKSGRPDTALTAEALRDALAYDPATGIFTCRTQRGPRKPGQVTGTPDHRGYVFIGLLNGFYTGHRLAWLYMTGAWPEAEVDHINRNPSDNRWVNLRAATRQQNALNQRPRTNRSLPRGVRRSLTRFAAYYMEDGKHHHVGNFATPEEAASARLAAMKEHRRPFCSP